MIQNDTKGYHLIFTEKGKVDEAHHEISKVLAPYGLEIEGWKSKTEILMGVSDATKMIQAVLK